MKWIRLLVDWKDQRWQRGSATFAGVMSTIILVLITAAMVDLYRIQDMRTFAYAAASDAALAGTSMGRDWSSYSLNGRISLDATEARASALTNLAAAMSARAVPSSDYSVDVQVLSAPTGGAIANYPPVARASQYCSADPCLWSETRPSVGVYVTITVPTMFFAFVNFNQPIVIHAFAASSVITL